MKRATSKAISLCLAIALILSLLPAVAITQASAATGYDRGYSGGRNGDGKQYAWGIDVSEHQGTGFNFQNLKNNGYSYVILRCGFVSRKDYRFEEYYTNAKAAGLDVGVYFYSYATTASEAAYEAQQCLSYISGKTFEYPVYFDFEDSSAYSYNSTLAYNICTTFLDAVAAEGYLVGLYGYAGWLDESYNGWVPTSQICQKYECWIANYYDSDGSSKNSYYSTRYGMYQYTSTNYVGGVGPLDTNRCYKDYPSIVKQYGFNGYTATGASTIADGTYSVQAYSNNGYALGVADAGTHDGANVELQTWNNSSEQKFVFESNGDGYYTIRNLNSGMYLDVEGGSSSNGTNVSQWSKNDSDNQLWQLKSAGDGNYYIVSKCNGLYLDLVAGTLADGTNIDVWAGDSYDNQKWKLTPAEVLSNGVYTATCSADRTYGWNVVGNSADNGANVQIHTEAHPFVLSRTSDGYYTIQFLVSDKYLDVVGSGSSNGTNLGQWEGATEENHKFTIVPNTDGTYSFVSKLNSLYVDVCYGTMADGTNLQCYEGNDGSGQKFFLNQQPADGTYTIRAYADADYVLAPESQTTDNAAIVSRQWNNSSLQKFVFDYNDRGFFTIRNVATGLYLDVLYGATEDGTSVIQCAGNGSDAQLWQLKDAGDGYYYIVSKCNGLYLDLTGGNATDGNAIVVWSGANENQKWKITPTDVVTDGVYRITSAQDSNYGWTVGAESTENGANVQLWSTTHPVVIQHTSDGYYTFRFLHSDKYLDVDNGGMVNETNLLQYQGESTVKENQKFTIIPNADGSYSVVSAYNGLYVDAYNGNMEDGTNIQCYEGNGGSAQKWNLTAIRTINDGVYQAGAYQDSTYVLDVEDHATEQGTKLQLLKDADADGQRFVLAYQGNGNYTIRDTQSNRLIELENGSRTKDTSFVLASTDTITESKLFRVIPYSDGSYGLVNVCSNQYIDLNRGSCEDGNVVHTWTSTYGGKTQRWWLNPTTIGVDGEYVIAASGDDRYVLDIANSSTEAGGNLIIAGDTNQNSQRFKLIDNGNGYYAIQNVNSGRYLNIDNSGTENGTNVIQWSNTEIQENELWSVIPNSDGTYSFVGKCNGLYLDLSGNTLADGTNVQVWENSNGSVIAAQRWLLTGHKHTFGETSTVIEPTCTEGGYTLRTCLYCHEDVKTDFTDATGHGDYQYTDNGDGTHKVTCGHCTYVESDAEEHDFVNGFCACGAAESTVPSDPELKNGIIAENGGLYYYVNGKIQYNAGLIELNGSYYYIRSGGQCAIGQYWITNTNGIMEEGYYIFGTDGKMLLDDEIKNGIIAENGGLYYYVNGKIQYNAGLIKLNGSYYYIRSGGQCAIGQYWITNTNGIMEEGYYIFGTDGKMLLDDEIKNGIVSENGGLFYYVDNELQYNAGLIEISGSYYYIRSNGQCATGRYWVTNTNGLVEEGFYSFGTDGKLVMDGTFTPNVKNGIVSENGGLYYYVGGVLQYNAGLILLDGDYYYVRSSGQCATGAYWIINTNGLLEEGLYTFGADGKMIR